MSATVPLDRPTVLVIHDDANALDLMTRLFEASGFDVATAVTGYRAQAYLEGARPVNVVVAPWDTHYVVGGEVYRWCLQRRYDLRDQFVFIGSELPPEFDQIVAGRCIEVSMARPNDIVRVAIATVRKRISLEAQRDAIAEAESSKPRLLLCDDEPVLLMVMGELLGLTYAVTRVESGHGAITLLEHTEFDAMVLDWHMDDGNGADVYRWILANRPWLAERVVFLSGWEGDDQGTVAPVRPMLRKGQDSHTLTTVLHEIVRQVRGSGAHLLPT